MAKRKVVVLGLDGATWKILRPLMKKGKMPFLKKLVEGGASGVLKSTIPPVTASVWTSFLTGTNPGKHGVFSFMSYREDPLNPRFYNSLDVKTTKLWEYLEMYSKKSLLVNLPLTFPPQKIDGAMVASFLTPKGEKYYYPDNIKKVLEEVGYEIDYLDEFKMQRPDLPSSNSGKKERQEFIARNLAIAKKRVEAVKKLITLDDFSFAYLLIKETDIVQHVFYDSGETGEFYEKLDGVIEDLYKFVQKNLKGKTHFFVVSDHGFHESGEIYFSPYAWLRQEGFIETGEGDARVNIWRALSDVNKMFKKVGINLSRKFLVKKKREALVSDMEEKQLESVVRKSGIRVIFQGIYLYGKTRSKKNKRQIVDKLRKLKYQGEKVFEKVVVAKDEYTGGETDGAPDIVWIPNDKFSVNISTLSEQVFGKESQEQLGAHSSDLEGIFLLKSDKIKKNKNVRLSITDMFPLVCYLLDVPLPGHVDGELPRSILKSKDRILTQREFVSAKIDEDIKKLIENE